MTPLQVIGSLDGDGYAVGFSDGASVRGAIRSDGSFAYIEALSNGEVALRILVPDEDVFVDNGDSVASRADCRYPSLPAANDELITLPAVCSEFGHFPDSLVLFPGTPTRFIVECDQRFLDDQGVQVFTRTRRDVVAVDDDGHVLFARTFDVAFADDVTVDIDGVFAAARGTDDGFLIAVNTLDGGERGAMVLRHLSPGGRTLEDLGTYPDDVEVDDGDRVVLDAQGRLYGKLGGGVRRSTVGAATSELLELPFPNADGFELVSR
ncbi:MAG: hypothetical protein Q8O67_28955 [Deltaproteobacteria bacterium]|nr:hypothetical protein [Deltaproteobacteria bacterium]